MTAIGPQSPNYTTVRPALDPNVSGAGIHTWFRDCSAAGAADGTIVTASWLNVITAQLRQAISNAGVVLDNSNDDMLSDAIIATVTAQMATLTAAKGVRRNGSVFEMSMGSGTLAPVIAASLDTNSDLVTVYDNSGNNMVETTIYQIVKATMATSTGVTFNDGAGSIYFNVPKNTSAPIAPASPAIGDTWYDTTLDVLFERVNDGSTDIWLQTA